MAAHQGPASCNALHSEGQGPRAQGHVPASPCHYAKHSDSLMRSANEELFLRVRPSTLSSL
jgi:hypothetical protein